MPKKKTARTSTQDTNDLFREEEKEIKDLSKTSKRRNRFSILVVIYLIIGLFFAVFFAKFYHWPPFGYFSPGFYFVILTWPFQLIHGFIGDFLYYGIQGPPFGG